MSVFSIIASSVGAFLSDRAELAAEIAALRQQLSILQHSAERPKLRKLDRAPSHHPVCRHPMLRCPHVAIPVLLPHRTSPWRFTPQPDGSPRHPHQRRMTFTGGTGHPGGPARGSYISKTSETIHEIMSHFRRFVRPVSIRTRRRILRRWSGGSAGARPCPPGRRGRPRPPSRTSCAQRPRGRLGRWRA